MNTQYQVSRSDFVVLTTIYKMLKGVKCNINRQDIIKNSGVPACTLSQRINNVHIKENILKESNYECKKNSK